MHLLPANVQAAAPQLFTCLGPDGPVRYPDPQMWEPPGGCRTATGAGIDFLLFTGSAHRHVLPFLFTSVNLFLKCFGHFHVVVPEREVDAVMPFLPNEDYLIVHRLKAPDHIVRLSQNRTMSMWKEIGQWVNLWAVFTCMCLRQTKM